MNSLNPVETQKIFDAISTYTPLLSTDTSYPRLWHARILNPYKGKTFRDTEKNLWKVYERDTLISIKAGINPAGIGDGKLPTHDITYSIYVDISAEKRVYRHRYFYDTPYVHGYMYARSIPELMEKFMRFLYQNNIQTL